MARFNPIKNNFVAGEISPRLEGRDDLDQYFQSLRQSNNGVVMPHGGFIRRSGTRFVASVKTPTHNTRLMPFQFSTTQAYVLEWGHEYVRFYANEGRLEDGGSPVEVSTPFSHEEVFDLQFAQNADVLWVVHPSHHPYVLTRTSPTSFSLAKVSWRKNRAPLQPQNLDATFSLTYNAPGGGASDTVTSSGPLFTAGDLGRVVWVENGANYQWALITGVNSSTSVDVAGDGTGAVSATPDWALGMFANTEGAYAVTFHEGRLVYGGSPSQPDRIVMSVSDDFNNFERRDPDAEDAENEDKSISRRLVSGRVNVIRWMSSASDRLTVGTTGDEFFITPGADDYLTPLNVVARPKTNRGSDYIRPIDLDTQTIFVQRNGRKLRELRYTLDADDYVAADVSILAEHILSAGVRQMAYQQDPDSVVWCVMNDGGLVGWTIERDQKVMGAHRHTIGGEFLTRPAGVASAAVIPNPTGTSDQLWLIVFRTIENETRQYVEFMERTYQPDVNVASTDNERLSALESAFFVDSGLTLDSPLPITNITRANPGVVTSNGHGLSNGDKVRIRDVVGMTQVNRRTFTVATATTNTFELSGVDTSGYDKYVIGGTVRKEVSELSGLDHLEGSTVSILADGAVHPDRVVEDGSISLARSASLVHVGLPFMFYGETQRFIGGGRLGTDQGQKARISRIVMRLHNTLGLKIGLGPRPTKFSEVLFRDGSDRMDSPPPLWTGDKEVSLEGGWTNEPTVYFLNDQPLPCTVLCIMPRAESTER
ncbi:ubiquitin-activating E1 FCCH domain-containing protein [uncultured Rhodospira sp.]|uniref:ubiquitin-activating E1 FCCH domain-containing protein n=1 Tax=uncultured Rhodospira sp. TaxID=1936189 RepID=UPI00261BEAC9|nr:ubiquitin-activating E1 FCCH domain-containing protein [uncultured Rhodospira sp.]